MRRIVAEGHILCNHTMHHDEMGSWSPEAMRADLEATSELIREIVAGTKMPYFRAPYRSWGRVPGVAAELGMQPLGWRLVVNDWEEPGALTRRLLDGITPRAVVLLHGGDRSGTVETVDRLIPELQAGGWRFHEPDPRG